MNTTMNFTNTPNRGMVESNVQPPIDGMGMTVLRVRNRLDYADRKYLIYDDETGHLRVGFGPDRKMESVSGVVVIPRGRSLPQKGKIDTLYVTLPDKKMYVWDDENYEWAEISGGSSPISVPEPVPDATDIIKGIMKLYDATGTNIDGTITQRLFKEAIDTLLSEIQGIKKDYAKKSDIKDVDLSDYAKKSDIKEVDLSDYAKKSDIKDVDLSDYVKKPDIVGMVMMKEISIIISTAGWISNNDEDYQYKVSIPDAAIKSDMMPELVFSGKNLSKAADINIAPYCDALDGSITVYASQMPTSSIAATLKLTFVKKEEP